MSAFIAYLNSSRAWVFALLIVATMSMGCRTAAPLQPADLSAPGWRVQQGQAVWKPGARRPEIAGELLVATNAAGSEVIQFTKDPFPLVNAQASGDRWQIDFASGRHSWRGHGQPPALFLWFQLPDALRGGSLKRPWKFSRSADLWRLENPRRGEWLEGRFFE